MSAQIQHTPLMPTRLPRPARLNLASLVACLPRSCAISQRPQLASAENPPLSCPPNTSAETRQSDSRVRCIPEASLLRFSFRPNLSDPDLDELSFEGEFFRIENLVGHPKPPHHGIVLVGGGEQVKMRIAAQCADICKTPLALRAFSATGSRSIETTANARTAIRSSKPRRSPRSQFRRITRPNASATADWTHLRARRPHGHGWTANSVVSADDGADQPEAIVTVLKPSGNTS